MSRLKIQADESPKWSKLPSSQIYLVGLFLVFIVGFGLQALLNYSIGQTIDRLDQQTQNTRYQGYLSENILHSIQTIETQFYRLTISQNASMREHSLAQIYQAKEAIEADLMVLQQGGQFSQRRLVQAVIEAEPILFDFNAEQTSRCPRTEAALIKTLAELVVEIEGLGACRTNQSIKC
jgi:hypothetical protein